MNTTVQTPGPTDGRRWLEPLLGRRGQLLSFLERRVGGREDAEEILQAAYLKSIEATTGDDVKNVEAWFYRILRNALVDHYRRGSATRRAHDRLAAEVESTFLPELRDETCRCVLEVLPRLRASYREILDRVDLRGDSVVSAAAQLGISAGNARTRLHRARRALREALTHVCGACAEHGCLDCSCRSDRASE